MRHTGMPVMVSISTDIKLDRKKHICAVILGAHYRSLRSQIVRNLMDYYIEASFDIDGFDDIIEESDGEIMLPQSFMSLMFCIGIGALRGMVALRTADTFLTHYPLPILRLDDLMEDVDRSRIGAYTGLKYEVPLSDVAPLFGDGAN